MTAVAGGAAVHGVKWLTNYLRARLETDPSLRGLRISGEVSNYKPAKGGTVYFSLSEEDSMVNCVAWWSDAQDFPEFKNGSKVVASGRVTVFEKRGACQLLVHGLQLEGVGEARKIFEQRRRRLAAEGLFEAERKRPLPQFPFRVALVSSPQSSGATDFVTRLRALRPHVRVVWCDASVQGANAPAEIVGAIGRASLLDVDLIVVTRGGGSFEDLFTFSHEDVVRAVAAAKHPVLCAVGHTVDQQLADFAADAHAETPSAAAERIGPETQALRDAVNDRARRMGRALEGKLEFLQLELRSVAKGSRLADARLLLLPASQRLHDADEALASALRQALTEKRERVARLRTRLQENDPGVRLARQSARLQELRVGLERLARERLAVAERRLDAGRKALAPAAGTIRERAAHRFSLTAAKLAGNDPEAILKKGYAIVTHAGRILLDPRDAPAGSPIEARLARGTLAARVEPEASHGNQRSG
jgi:exodeoxyribonuclease VII large subunit